MIYLLDSNVFMQAKNLYYGMDFCPAFWEWLIEKNKNKEVFSIEKVGDEIKAGADELAAWASKLGPEFFLKPDPAILPALARISSWVTRQKYEPAAVSTFLQGTDYYLIGHALAHGYTVVTHEVVSNSTKIIKIPSVCIGLDIKCMTAFEMLSQEKARFILGR